MNTYKKSVRMAAAWLCTLLLVPSLISCGDSKADSTDTKAAADQGKTEAQTTEALDVNQAAIEKAVAEFPEQDYGGTEFRFLCRSENNWGTIDIYSEKENGDSINDAVYQRNRILEENFNIKIAQNQVDNPYEDAKRQISAGDSDFDVMTDGLYLLGSMVPEGYLIDLKTVPNLNLSNPWWDQEMNTGLSIKGKQFFATGDISISDNDLTWCIMFNKDIANDFDLGDLYTLVRDGKWTLDVMHDMAKTVTQDLDGNGVIDPDDQWGFATESFNQYALWAGGGERILTKDKDDLPSLTAYSERSVEVMDKVTELQTDTSCTMHANNVDGGCTFTNESFGNGRTLFLCGGMWLVTKYRGYDINFGILPCPKYNEEQDRYYNTYSYWNCTAYAVPTTNQDLEKTGTLLEAMAEISKYTLTPAYYDISLKGKFIRDDESAEMLDLILAQRIYDLGNVFDMGGMFNNILTMNDYRLTDFASLYAKKQKATQKAIDRFIDSLDRFED